MPDGRWQVAIERTFAWAEVGAWDDPDCAIAAYEAITTVEGWRRRRGTLAVAIFDTVNGEGEPLDADAVRDLIAA